MGPPARVVLASGHAPHVVGDERFRRGKGRPESYLTVLATTGSADVWMVSSCGSLEPVTSSDRRVHAFQSLIASPCCDAIARNSSFGHRRAYDLYDHEPIFGFQGHTHVSSVDLKFT